MDRSLPCQQIVYRAYRARSWYDPDTGGPLTMAFIRRRQQNELSVDRTYDDARSALNKCYGAATLHVGHVRDSGLNVEPRPTEHCQGSAAS